MSFGDAVFHETTAEREVQQVGLSHLSIELGHLYLDDLLAGPERLVELFAEVAPWAATARQQCVDVVGPSARISTCFMIDDYFASQLPPPAELLPMIQEAAAAAQVRIDYLARESGCAESEGVPLAGLVVSRLVAEPWPGTTGSRPPVTESGWLSNGQRSPGAGAREATDVVGWAPPRQSAASPHSIFVDVQLWDEVDGRRRWSCPMLASVWQLLRLGVLRDRGAAVGLARPLPDPLPASWAEMPAVLQLAPAAKPFCALRTFSVLPARFQPIEDAVRTILSQVSIEQAVLDQLRRRTAGDRLIVPADIVERTEYVFTVPRWQPVRPDTEIMPGPRSSVNDSGHRGGDVPEVVEPVHVVDNLLPVADQLGAGDA